ncbi:MAG: hypothetical protein PVG83_03285 [Acidimicrobiia bacterium]|jgi:hypothetical protein
MKTMEEVAKALDGTHLRRVVEDWSGFFEGEVTAEVVEVGVGDNVEERLSIEFPTSPYDVDDYVWRSELEAGSTDKITVISSSTPINQKVTSIRRLSQGEGRPVRYRIELALDPASVGDTVGLRLGFGEQDLATAEEVRS